MSLLSKNLAWFHTPIQRGTDLFETLWDFVIKLMVGFSLLSNFNLWCHFRIEMSSQNLEPYNKMTQTLETPIGFRFQCICVCMSTTWPGGCWTALTPYICQTYARRRQIRLVRARRNKIVCWFGCTENCSPELHIWSGWTRRTWSSKSLMPNVLLKNGQAQAKPKASPMKTSRKSINTIFY